MDKKEEKVTVRKEETVTPPITAPTTVPSTEPKPVEKPVEKVAVTKPEPIKKPSRRMSITSFLWLIFILFFACTFTMLGIIIGTKVFPAVEQWMIDHNFRTGQSTTKESNSPFLPQPTSQANNGAKGSSATTIPQIVKQVSPSVVSIAIVNTTTNPGQLVPGNTVDKIGTGFIVDSSGVIITNQHVVSDTASQYQVVTPDNKTFKVKTIMRDDVNDIALLTVDGGNFQAVKLGDSDSLEPGETVIAIGTPLGEFPGSVTVGVISGLKRSVTAGSGFWSNQKTYESVIQTDAAVNPGNSGGPLLNLAGEVIGVNFATTGNADNISFALPINLVKQKLGEYKQYGKFRSPYLGVGYRMVTQQEASFYNIQSGALVNSVIKGSPAEKAGLQVGDIITQVNGQKITATIAEIISKLKIGDEVTLTVFRTDLKGTSQTLTLKATLADRPAGQ